MLKMATYPSGMTLGGEVRESVSLDEDDLTDVEDEVFIRDGKNSYKLAEELNAKRPLMAPRRKPCKPDITTRLKARPPCRAFCRPCCYIAAALSVLVGLIALVVILVSIFPLPLDRLRDWVINKSKPGSPGINKAQSKLLPCSSLKVSDVWVTNLPVLTTDSPVRTLDINRDGVDDVIFGFGTGDNYNILPPDIFCPIFLGVQPPCEGGVIALNGATGDIVWRYWVNDTIFSLHCTADVNEDGLDDCLAVGVDGTVSMIDSRNGSVIWRQNNSKLDIYVANFVPDQNNDTVPDVLASHTRIDGRQGHVILICGKTGRELRRIAVAPANTTTFFMPQVFNATHVLLGTGSPTSPGNLSLATLGGIVTGNLTGQLTTIYEDRFKGVLTQSIVVDITGDGVPDIVTSMFNSTVVAIDGKTLRQIWNYTVPNSESSIEPTPGYFNDDNVTDFLIVYQKYDNILNYNYTKTFIIDGKTGRPVYAKPISGSVLTQMGGLTLSMEAYGFDMFVFWTTECSNIASYKSENAVVKENNLDALYDVCRRQFNTTSILKLNALNQFDQPPGFEIYNSVNRTALEFANVKSPMKRIKEYFKKHPKIPVINNNNNNANNNNDNPMGQSEIDENYNDGSQKIRIHKYGSSSFRHKDNRQGMVKNSYMPPPLSPPEMPLNSEIPEREISLQNPAVENPGKFDNDYEWGAPPPQANPANMMNILPGDMEPDFGNYNMDDDPALFQNQKQMLFDELKNQRDPRSKQQDESPTGEQQPQQPQQQQHQQQRLEKQQQSSKKKNLSDGKNGIYDYKNIRLARNRLLHDLNNLPSEILKDTYFKNRENRLRKSKFEQRDINSHIDKMQEKEDVKKILEQEKNQVKNASLNLWDLESEKEVQDRENGYWRGKRQANYTSSSIRKISSVGAIVQSLNASNNSLDVIFITYWQPSIGRDILKQEVDDCIEEKLSNASEDQVHSYQKTTADEQRALFTQECITEKESLKNDFPYFNQIYQLSLGQMTVYRIRIECLCDVAGAGERCAKFNKDQDWPTYLGQMGDGIFPTKN